MKLHTAPQLATLPNARLIRRHDAVRSVWQSTPKENTAHRCACRMSVLSDAARLQMSTMNTASLSLA